MSENFQNHRRLLEQLKAEIGFPEQGYWQAFPELLNDFIETSRKFTSVFTTKTAKYCTALIQKNI
jgi:hypothetical protein